jgi:hypothetical protein
LSPTCLPPGINWISSFIPDTTLKNKLIMKKK